ncbi:hypothetical protein M1R55_25830 (plasmid) [Deinococcus sp. QL22]|nr:hypothetical protein [Deinococcus sp. QL22]UQN09570.1 hypothetical protein M1R55_25830 [Deinococcus sp. QL22]
MLLANPQLPPYQLSTQRTRLQELSRTRDKLAQQRKANQMSSKRSQTRRRTR